MSIPESRFISKVECATCPDCERVLVLGHLPPESKRPFVQGHAQGWVITCQGCGSEFPVRHSEIFQTAVEQPRVH
jgi:hypothetical protein